MYIEYVINMIPQIVYMIFFNKTVLFLFEMTDSFLCMVNPRVEGSNPNSTLS